jgi:hypothetical protein
MASLSAGFITREDPRFIAGKLIMLGAKPGSISVEIAKTKFLS